MGPDRDELYDKYLVVKHPHKAISDEFPPVVTIVEIDGEIRDVQVEAVTDPVFVLKPGSDHHARVAIAAYMMSCRQTHPQLSADLEQMLTLAEAMPAQDDIFDQLKEQVSSDD